MNVLYFACMMASFVLGITFGFNLLEETGYLARISFLFDNTMSRVGLQGKTIMPFFMGLGCTIAGATGTRVVDNWGQRVLVIVSIFLFMFLMMWVVYKVFGNSLAPKEERVGLIMELPPYHKPDLRNTIYVTFERTLDIFWRALRVIFIVSIVFFVLTYGFGGNAENSILYRVGVVIEPVTMFFGLKMGSFSGVHFCHQLQHAMHQCAGCHRQGNPLREMDRQDWCVLRGSSPFSFLHRVPCGIAGVLGCANNS